MRFCSYAFSMAFLLSSPSSAEMALTVATTAIRPSGYIDPQFAFCIHTDPAHAPPGLRHIKPGLNKSPDIKWGPGPHGTKSYAILMTDTDGPTDFTNIGKEGVTVSAMMPRTIYYRWVLVNIPPNMRGLDAGADNHIDAEDGTDKAQMPYGLRGLNDYSKRNPLDVAHKRNHIGYDGPCPPPNDELVHHYHIKVFALDVERLNINGSFYGTQAAEEIAKHTLASGEIIGKYTLNPALLFK